MHERTYIREGRGSIVVTLVASLWAILFTALGPVYAQNLSVNWGSLSYTTSPLLFGSNDQQAANYATNSTGGPEDAGYSTAMAATGIKFMRIHNSGLTSDWSSGSAPDESLISPEFQAGYIENCDGNVMVTLGDVPSYCLNSDGSINDAEYASFCASMVEMINVTLGANVKYWEIDNEWNGSTFGDGSGFFTLYNDCAAAMKAVDPTIKIGGPTASWCDYNVMPGFLQNCWSNIDFISWHLYYAGGNFSGPSSNYTLMYTGFTGTIDTDIAYIQWLIQGDLTNGYAPHPILLDIDEYNIPADYSYTGWGQQGYIGATFDAATLIHFAQDGLDMGASWNAKDNGTYGMINFSDALLPPATVYAWANSSLVGKVAATTSDNANVQVLAIDRGAGASGNRYSFLVTNYAASTSSITLTHGLPAGETASVSIINSAGVQPTTHPSVTGSTLTLSLGQFACALVTMPGGSLAGSGSAAGGTVNLTAQGTTDWAQWGYYGTTIEHDSAGGSKIQSTLPAGSTQYTNNGVGFSWTNGTPTTTVTASTTGVYVANGTFTVTAPATTTSHTLKIYVGGWKSTGQITASLSDGSAANFTATNSNSTGSYYEVYTFTYTAASAGQTLTVAWKQTAGSGNVTLQAATLL